MNGLDYILQYTITQAVMVACCDKMEQEIATIIAQMPEDKREHAPVQVTLNHTENKTVQLWYEANSAQRELIRDRERNV